MGSLSGTQKTTSTASNDFTPLSGDLHVEQEQNLQDHIPSNALTQLSLSSQAVHADDFLNVEQDVAPSLHVSTTFRYPKDPDVLKPITKRDVRPPAVQTLKYRRIVH